MEGDAGNTGDAALAHGFANDRESLLADFVVRRNEIAVIEIDRINVRFWHETFYIDRVAAFDLDRGQFLVAHRDVVAFADFVAFDPVLAVDDFPCFTIHILLFEPMPRLAIQKVEGDFVLVAGGGEQGHRTRNKRQLEVTFPICTWRHDDLFTQREESKMAV